MELQTHREKNKKILDKLAWQSEVMQVLSCLTHEEKKKKHIFP